MIPFDKQIYNCFLKNSRFGQAWKPRKDFEGISAEVLNQLQHLRNFFNKFRHISMEEFFYAPIDLHPDDPYPYLSYFISRKAIKTYTLFKSKQRNQNPDNQLENIKSGFEFITKYCLEENIPLENYIHKKNGLMLIWTEHYRNYQINPYCLMEMGDLNLEDFTLEEAELWVPGLKDLFKAFKSRYANSTKAKTLVKNATQKLKQFLSTELQSV